MDPKIEDNMFHSDEKYNPIINGIVLGKNAGKNLEEIKLKILREYAKNPGISDIRIDKLEESQKNVLRKEIEPHYQDLKKQIEPYEGLWEKLQ